MKRIFAVLTVVFALFSVLCGCVGNRGGTDAPSSSENTAEKEPPAAAWKAHFLNVGKADAILLEADGLFYIKNINIVLQYIPCVLLSYHK